MTTPTTIWYTRCPVPTTSGIAQHFGWLQGEFARHGIAVESIRAAADKTVRLSHFDHTHENQFREGGNVPPLWARGQGRDTVVVGITWVDEEQLILVRDDSPLHTAADLKGARLGLPLHDSRIVDIGRAEDLRGLLTALQIAGIARDEVSFVDVLGGDFDLGENREVGGGDKLRLGAEALLAGKVDAIYAKGAFSATLIERHGFRPILDINEQADPLLRVNAGTPRPITVNRALAAQHPEIVARYLAVLQQTAQWAATHPDAVVSAIAAETGATEAAVRRGFGPHLHERFTVTLSDISVAG
ncbi:MAG TPA: ABC transporter substrate-binding protein, partial [Novosphingobium sp.]|nr:ABC transporter substrate-binding protein [Novosphingobium sp.]